MTWRLHIEMIKAKAFTTFIRIYSLFKSERLSANIKLTLHKALIRCVMTYACPAWEFAAECHLLKLQRLPNKVPCTIGNFPKCTSVCNMHTSFFFPPWSESVSELYRPSDHRLSAKRLPTCADRGCHVVSMYGCGVTIMSVWFM
jgi:hypothetical protein